MWHYVAMCAGINLIWRPGKDKRIYLFLIFSYMKPSVLTAEAGLKLGHAKGKWSKYNNKITEKDENPSVAVTQSESRHQSDWNVVVGT